MTLGRVKAAVLSVWAAFFVWLLASGEVYRYIGPRTYWVVIFGAVCLSLAAVGYVILAMSTPADRTTTPQVVGVAILLAPILLVVLIPKPSLGSLAASRKLTGGSTAALALKPSTLQPGEELSFQDLSYAASSPEYAAGLGLSEGYEVDLVGFISGAETGAPDAVALTRFSIFCCAADAVPYTIPVNLPPDAPAVSRDTWIKVEGAVFQHEDTWVVEAQRVEKVGTPENPYI